MTVRHPEVVVTLSGTCGNAFAVIGAVRRAMRRAQVDPTEIDLFSDEAMSGDYNHLLATAERWVTIY